MITASIVLYNSDPSKFEKVLKVWGEADNVGVLYLVDNSPVRSEYFTSNIFKKIQYLFADSNLGYGAGHNIALRKILATSKYHIIINPDIEIDNGVISGLSKFMEEHPDVGHVMPKILYPDNSIQYVCKLLPTPFDLFARRFLPSFLFKKSADRFCLKFTNYEQVMDAPNLSGCFMFLRVSALKQVGLFDERFFMYMEDIDLTRRINQQYRTVFYPEVEVYHEHAAESYKNMKFLKMHINSIFKYFNKWGWFFDGKRRRVNEKTLSQIKLNASNGD